MTCAWATGTDDKWEDGFGDRGAGNNWFSFHRGNTNATFTQIPFFSNSRNHGVGEAESPGGMCRRLVVIFDFDLQQDLPHFLSELSWVSSWLLSYPVYICSFREGKNMTQTKILSFIEYVYSINHWALRILYPLLFSTVLKGCCYCPHFTDGDSEVQKVKVTFLEFSGDGDWIQPLLSAPLSLTWGKERGALHMHSSLDSGGDGYDNSCPSLCSLPPLIYEPTASYSNGTILFSSTHDHGPRDGVAHLTHLPILWTLKSLPPALTHNFKQGLLFCPFFHGINTHFCIPHTPGLQVASDRPQFPKGKGCWPLHS